MSRLGDTIRTARVQAKMTEKALGKKCGLAESVIKDIELGRRIASDDQAQRILKVLGVQNPVSTELEVAAEPPQPMPRPKPRAYVVPLEPEHPAREAAAREASDAWLDALGGVVKRVPVIDPEGVAVDHVLTPIVGGKIEGGAPDKVLFYRCPDNALRGFRVFAGDLLLVVPASRPENDRLMLVLHKGRRIVRKLLALDGDRIQLQSFDYEFTAQVVSPKDVQILGRCVRLQRTL